MYTYESESEVAQSCLTLCDPTDCTCQALLSMGFSKQDYWFGLPFLSPGDPPDSGKLLLFVYNSFWNMKIGLRDQACSHLDNSEIMPSFEETEGKVQRMGPCLERGLRWRLVGLGTWDSLKGLSLWAELRKVWSKSCREETGGAWSTWGQRTWLCHSFALGSPAWAKPSYTWSTLCQPF